MISSAPFVSGEANPQVLSAGDLDWLRVPNNRLEFHSFLALHGVQTACLQSPLGEMLWQTDGAMKSALQIDIAKTVRLATLELGALQELDTVLPSNLKVLIYKGAALAHSLYPSVALRPHVDIDMWVAPSDRQRIHEILQDLGYRAEATNISAMVLPEQNYQRVIDGARIVIDLHWQCSARPLLARALTHQRVWQSAQACSGCSAIRVPDRPFALLLAVAHLFGHRHLIRLIWLLDIHLLWRAMSVTERNQCHMIAGELALSALLASALLTANQYFSTPIERAYWQSQLQSGLLTEASAKLMQIQNRAAAHSYVGFDFRHATWRERLTLFSNHCWADSTYLLARYQKQSRAWLPWLQFKRWWAIASKKST